MRLGDFIPRNHIIHNLRAQSKEEAIAELVDVLVSSGEIRPEKREDVLVALLKREAIAHTGIGMGIAVPHALVKSVRGTIGALGVSRGGVPFDQADPARVIFLFVSPDDDPQEHLKVLALVSRLANDPDYVRILKNAGTRTRINRLLREAEDRVFPDGPTDLP
ncbi:MAG: PTS sugar transporter subunit IIA [Planctomycetota bacterium]|jgi:mannitol/fructose-specific phosphotransferase system IIA component (Ntr-type)